MSGLRARLANSLWQATCLPAWYSFLRATREVKAVQHKLLLNYLAQNQGTEYGRRFKFAELTSVEAYQAKVPLTSYDDYTAAIEAISQGQQGVLTTSPVLRFELSSGSTAASKLLPYTRQLKAEFQRGIASWMANLFQHQPHLKGGAAYWSLTPLTAGRRFTSAGIPIGFEEDSAYLGVLGKYLVEAALAVPNAVKYMADVATFRYVTLRFLLGRPDLRLVSVWNPTFLSLLLAPLPEWWARLIDDIAQGTLSPPAPLGPKLAQPLLSQLRPDPWRAEALAASQPTDYQAIWPNLSLISCWLDGPAARYAQSLEAQFPRVAFQGKGLIATEAFVSLPIAGFSGAVMAVTSHFFEFLPVDQQTYQPLVDRPKLAYELERGQTYAVVVTTGGGFYRYQLQDLVTVVDAMGQAPCLRFLGKTDQVSDWFGEKLNQHFVGQVLEGLFHQYGLRPLFAMLAPDDEDENFRYTLYLELPPDQRSLEALTDLKADLDRKLRQNFHYDYCRRLGQLATPEIFQVKQEAMAAYLRACQAQGQRLGDIKPSPLQKTTGWSNYFIRAGD